MSSIAIDTSELQTFFQRMNVAGSGILKEEIGTWMDTLGEKFLEAVQKSILAGNVVDTRRLLGSFTRGASENVFEKGGDGLSIEVGTNVYYARWVEEGHRTRGGKGWIVGRFYFANASRAFQRILPMEVSERMGRWLKEYLGG